MSINKWGEGATMRVLVVEDEKLIRQGIKTMIQKSSIQIEEILECKNGEEALEVLSKEVIDILFTDIKMPKMDGLQLIQNIYDKPNKPEIVIISGYDDFTYAVEALRWGAGEYVLKPVHREDITKILTKLEKIVAQKKDNIQKETDFKSLLEQFLKYILINKNITTDEFRKINNAIDGELLDNEAYKVYCWYTIKQSESFDGQKDVIYLEDIEGYRILIVKQSTEYEVLERFEGIQAIGISNSHQGLHALRQGYTEAYMSRNYAYLNKYKYTNYSEIQNKEKSEKAANEIDITKFVQQLGTERVQEGSDQFSRLFEQKTVVYNDYQDFEETLKNVLQQTASTYQVIIENNQLEKPMLEKFLKHESLEIYKKLFNEYIEAINRSVLQEHEDFKSKQKMKEALAYININYNKDLNMAVVSNYVSMNYSFFSQIFKEYTGMNFVNYIKEIRINKSKELLANTREKVAAIGCLVGYENEKHFMKVFKSVMGVSPTEYRKNAQIGK